MGLTPNRVRRHIQRWETHFQGTHRERWPSRLFHHSPLENAVSIIKDGCIRSRLDPENRREKDVAAGDVIRTRHDSHDSVRLYFRPRTPTQYHIEGIRKADECNLGENVHAPVIIMFVFDSLKLLTLSNIRFSDRNMQSPSTVVGDSEDYFDNIPFDKVYHEGGISGDRTIITHRCAEVLHESPLYLRGNLQWIYCRSAAERDTLLFQLGEYGNYWASKIRISDDIRVFLKNHAFAEEVKLTPEGVVFRLHPRVDLRKIAVSIIVATPKDVPIHFRHGDMAALPNYPAKQWIHRKPLSNGRYYVKMTIDGHLAFENYMLVGPELF
jgi:hypothetical protein